MSFETREKAGIDPNSAHLITFALEVGMEEVDGLIEAARLQSEPAVERLRRHRDNLAQIKEEFSAATSENLKELADRTEAIASDLADVEELLDVGENEQGFHCALAASRLSGEAMISRRQRRAVPTAAFVFLFMSFLAAQASTGFMRDLFEGRVYPRAMRALDWILGAVTVPLGAIGGGISLLLLGAVLAALILRREPKEAIGEKRQVPDQPSLAAENPPSEIKREVPPAPLIGERSESVWISGICHSDGMSYKRGARTKFFNHDWEPATYEIPVHPDDVHEAFRRHWQGHALQRSDFPEALAIFDAKRFAMEKDFFMAGPFAAVKGKLVDVLSRFDLGEGGLIPFTVFEADLATPHPGEFCFLNFGARKNSLLPDQCGDAEVMFIVKTTGRPYWKLNRYKPDSDIVLSSAALDGPDVWIEEDVYNEVFMSDRLVQALTAVGMDGVFKLRRCRVVDPA